MEEFTLKKITLGMESPFLSSHNRHYPQFGVQSNEVIPLYENGGFMMNSEVSRWALHKHTNPFWALCTTHLSPILIYSPNMIEWWSS